jgi:hypothetical protein
MAEPEKKPPFYEHRAFQGAVAVIGLLTAAWALVGAPRPWTVATEIAAVETPLSNTEVLLVADKSMGEEFDGTTKMEAAVEAIGVIGRSTSNQGLALRRGGTRCGDPGEQVVGFGSHHGDDIEAAARDVQPTGQADLSTAINGALDDLESPSLNRPGARKGVIVFLGGRDKCDDEAIADVRREIEAHGVSPQFKIIALVDSKKEASWVGHLEAGLQPWDVDVVKATTREEVKETAADAAEETAAGAPPDSSQFRSAAPVQEDGAGDRAQASQAEGEADEEGVERPDPKPSPDGEEEGEGESELEEGEEVEGAKGGGEGEETEAGGGTIAPGETTTPPSGSAAQESGAAGTSSVAGIALLQPAFWAITAT